MRRWCWSEEGLLQAAFKKKPWLLKKLLLATKRESAHISNKHLCDASGCDLQKQAKTKGAIMCHFAVTIFKRASEQRQAKTNI